MRTEDLLEQCLQALASGQELPPDLARYLARHPEQRAEVEDLLFVARRASSLPSAELSTDARSRMQQRLATRFGFDAAALDAPATTSQTSSEPASRKLGLPNIRRVSVAKLRYEPPNSPADDRIRAAFRDLTPEDIRRYIGVRGEDYLYYRQRLPGWEPVFAFLAVVLRGFKRLEKLVPVQIGQ